MKTHWWLGVLAVGLTACGSQLEVAPNVALTQQHKDAFAQQAKLLGAEQVKVSATEASSAAPAVLTLDVVNPHSSPEQTPDSLKQRMRKLAHLLVADLASPASYQVVSAQATFRRSLRSPRNGSSSQTFIYPLSSLK
ncbi:hypothetical protein GCM10023172_27130 [Hymenobacter ginsengisoli]|uniref:Lipoprotein n=1 Tax=Hymenobacter ginsengisoli TaxID=1051626 RepID=A0ABP8QJM8_9BACT|nr:MULTISPECIES: hypothetical protein [unclassified Hymenobacter]MBO2030031.1 hypothetical protein [Hymenobacter sp. BT559]